MYTYVILLHLGRGCDDRLRNTICPGVSLSSIVCLLMTVLPEKVKGEMSSTVKYLLLQGINDFQVVFIENCGDS